MRIALKVEVSPSSSVAFSLLHLHSMFKRELCGSTASITLMVLQHLMSNPGAKDTLEGIRKWWVATRRQEPRADELQAVLDELLHKDWLVRFKPRGSKYVYGLNKERLQEIQQELLPSCPSAKQGHET